jgi:hypothetical protein
MENVPPPVPNVLVRSTVAVLPLIEMPRSLVPSGIVLDIPVSPLSGPPRSSRTAAAATTLVAGTLRGTGTGGGRCCRGSASERPRTVVPRPADEDRPLDRVCRQVATKPRRGQDRGELGLAAARRLP